MRVETPAEPAEVADPAPPRYDFEALLARHGIELPPRAIETLQVNITKMCNQVCRHCHVDASPARTESLSREGIERIVALLAQHEAIGTLDITGGAPELHPDFEWLVREARALGRRVIVRHNLTVTFDGHPQSGRSMAHLPQFFAEMGVEVVCSLPYYQEFFTDAQRGSGVFDKSIAGLRQLNALGYGLGGEGDERGENSGGKGLVLHLVYNPVGPYLPAAQATLEADYKRELRQRFGIEFNHLFTITNIPINRFALHLKKSGQFEAYMERLLSAFNPQAADGVMCRSMISVAHDGTLYDCDFNQMLDMPLAPAGQAAEAAAFAEASQGAPNLFDFDFPALMQRRIRFGPHCLACTAGAGSSCGGATA